MFLRYICVSANTINGITCSAPTVCYCITWYTAREERVGDNGEVASQLRLTRSSALLQLSVSQLSCTPTVPLTPTVRLSAQLYSNCPYILVSEASLPDYDDPFCSSTNSSRANTNIHYHVRQLERLCFKASPCSTVPTNSRHHYRPR